MNLCIDFGNTNVKLSVYEGDFERFYYTNKTLTNEDVDEVFEKYTIEKTIVSSTRILEDELIHHIKSKSNLIVLSHETKVPVINLYETPETLGKDRLAAVVGAIKLFPDTNCIVIDAGTCITMDFIDSKKQYHGGNISPGIYMRRQAMHDFTDKLPLVDFEFPSSYIGKSTEKAMKNGIMRGTIYEIESFIELIIKDFGDSNVLFTGGDTKFFEEHLKFTIFASPNLVLVGLNEILKFND